MPEEHEAKDSKKTKAHIDKGSNVKIADDRGDETIAKRRLDTKASNAKTEKVNSAKTTDTSANKEKNSNVTDVTIEKESGIGDDKNFDADKNSNEDVTAENVDKNDSIDDTKKLAKPKADSADKGNEVHRDNVRYAKKNEPKKRGKNYSAFLLIGIVALILLFVYLLLSSGVFKGTLRNDVIAEVNNEKIALETFKSAYSQLPLSMQTQENKELLLSQMINRTLVLQEASKKGVMVSDSEMDAVLERDYKANFQTDEDYESALVQAGITEADLLELIYYQLSEEKLIMHLFPNITAEQSEVEDFFSQNKEAIVGFYAAYFGTNVTTLDGIYEEIEEIVVLNKTIYLFSEYIDDLLSKSEIVINTELLGEIETNYGEPEDILGELNASDTNGFVISPEEIEAVEEGNESISLENESVGNISIEKDANSNADALESSDNFTNNSQNELIGDEK